tara:strand:+ start:396 stop:647 length:252 start_codon:yes stop_codon:yes gene_type:complete
MYIKEENGYFNDGNETPAFLIWKGKIGEELIAGPMKEAEADKMLLELQPQKKTTTKTKKAPAKKAPAKKAPAKKTKKVKNEKK